MIPRHMGLVWALVFILATRGAAQPPPKDSIERRLYLTQLNAAEAFLNLNLTGEAKKLLGGTNPQLRGWEYRLLNSMADRSSKTLTGHRGNVASIAFSPGGIMVASGGTDSTIILWNVASGEIVRRLTGHTGQVSTLDFSPDGRILASGSSDKTVKLWNIADGKNTGTITEGLSQGVYQVRFSPDGRMVVAASWERHPEKNVASFAKLFDPVHGREVQRFDLDDHPASVVDFSPDGKNVLVAGWNMWTRYFTIADGKALWSLDIGTDGPYAAVQSADISGDGNRIVIGGKDNLIRIVDANSGTVLKKLDGHKHYVNGVRFSPDGRFIVSGSSDGLLKLWDAGTFECVQTLRGHAFPVNSVAYSPDGQVIASASKDGTVKFWNTTRYGELTFTVCNGGPWYAPISPNQQWMAAACSDTVIGVWNLANGERTKQMTGYNANCAAFSSDNALLFTGSHDRLLRVWDLAREVEIKSLAGHTRSIFGIAFNDAKKLIATASTDGSVRVWSTETWDSVQTLSAAGNAFYAVHFTPDGEYILGGSTNGQIRVWKTSDWSLVKTIRALPSLAYFSMSPNGELLAVGGNSGEVAVWDWANEKLKYTLDGHSHIVTYLEFFPDGAKLITCSYDYSVKVWDMLTGENTLTMRNFTNEVYRVGLVDGGEKLMVTFTNGTVHVISLD